MEQIPNGMEQIPVSFLSDSCYNKGATLDYVATKVERVSCSGPLIF